MQIPRRHSYLPGKRKRGLIGKNTNHRAQEKRSRCRKRREKKRAVFRGAGNIGPTRGKSGRIGDSRWRLLKPRKRIKKTPSAYIKLGPYWGERVSQREKGIKSLQGGIRNERRRINLGGQQGKE